MRFSGNTDILDWVNIWEKNWTDRETKKGFLDGSSTFQVLFDLLSVLKYDKEFTIYSYG